MLKVSVLYHKDGDHLVINEVPWWYDIFIWTNDFLFCPCHGVSGMLSKIGLLEKFFYNIWSFLHGVAFKVEKELYRVAVASGCVLSTKIFKRTAPCWNDECENCWHLREDAYSSEGT